MVYHGIPCLHYGIAEELIKLKYTITVFCPSYAAYSVTVSCRIALFSAISIGPIALGPIQSIQQLV